MLSESTRKCSDDDRRRTIVGEMISIISWRRRGSFQGGLQHRHQRHFCRDNESVMRMFVKRIVLASVRTLAATTRESAHATRSPVLQWTRTTHLTHSPTVLYTNTACIRRRRRFFARPRYPYLLAPSSSFFSFLFSFPPSRTKTWEFYLSVFWEFLVNMSYVSNICERIHMFRQTVLCFSKLLNTFVAGGVKK